MEYGYLQQVLLRWKESELEAVEFERDKVRQEISYKHLYEDVISMMNHCDCRNTHVGILGENSYEWVVVSLATGLQGGDGMFVAFDPKIGTEDLVKLAQYTDTTVMFYDNSINAKKIDAIKAAMPELLMYEMKETVKKWRDDLILSTDCIVPYDKKEAMGMVFTSGTTKEPKAAMISYEGVEDYALHEMEVLMGRDQLRVMIQFPLYHIAGLVDLEFWGLFSKRVLCLSRGYHNILKDLNYFNPDFCGMAPALAELYLNAYKECNDREKVFGKNLDTIFIGSAPSINELFLSYKSLGITFINGYGMTETLGMVMGSDSSSEDMRIIRPSGGNKAALTEDGELIVKTAHQMIGYYKRQEETDNILKDGWVYTGDVGTYTEDGGIQIIGRKKDVIVLGTGQKISPAKIEEKIDAYEEIRESLVYLKDGDMDTNLFAIIVPEETMAALSEKEQSEKVEKIIDEVNKTLPIWSQILGFKISTTPLPRTELGKLKRLVAIKEEKENERENDTVTAC